METPHTNKILLAKGIKRLAVTMLLLFTGPVILYSAFQNQEHPLFILVLSVGIGVAIAAIIMGFISIKTLLDSLFQK